MVHEYNMMVLYVVKHRREQQNTSKLNLLTVPVALRVGAGAVGDRGKDESMKGKPRVVLTARQHCYQYDSTRPNVCGLCMVRLY